MADSSIAPEQETTYEPQYVCPRANADVILLSCDGVRFPAHKAYLSASSTLFENLFSDAQQNNTAGLPEIPMVERAMLLDYLLCHSYANLGWSLEKTDEGTCVELLDIADKFGHPRLMASVVPRFVTILATPNRTLTSEQALGALSMGYRFQQQPIIAAALQHCGYWDRLNHLESVDPAIGFQGMKQLMTVFRDKHIDARLRFYRIEEQLLHLNEEELFEWRSDNLRGEEEGYSSTGFDWSKSSPGLVMLWKTARELLDEKPHFALEHGTDYTPPSNATGH